MPGLIWEQRELELLFNTVKKSGFTEAAKRLARTELACTRKYYRVLEENNPHNQLFKLIKQTGQKVRKYGNTYKIITN